MTATSSEIDGYCETCRATFRDRPETHRIDLYAAHASRDSDNPVHIYRLANACLEGGSTRLWHEGIALALTRSHDTTRSVGDRREVLRRLGDWSNWYDEPWPTKQDEGVPTVADDWWDGVEDLSGKTLVIYDCGGHGDTIRWLRFAEALHDKVPIPTCWPVPPELLSLVKYNFGHLSRMQILDLEHVYDPTQTDAHFDRAMNAKLIPRVVDALPPFVRWRAPAPSTLPERTSLARLGLVWSSQPFFKHLERSVPIGVLMPFFWRPDVEFYSLQVGVREEDAVRYPRLCVPDPPLDLFADTANLVASLDGVITVDTAVAHLAGSLGVPTLTLLAFLGDPYWGLNDTTPWYPSMRIIRQRDPWDWRSVQADLQQALDSRWWETIAG